MKRQGNFRYTELEKQELLEQYRQSGKSKTGFCRERGLSFCTLHDWLGGKKKKSARKRLPGFVPVNIKHGADVFAEVVLSNGSTVKIYNQVDAGFLSKLLK